MKKKYCLEIAAKVATNGTGERAERSDKGKSLLTDPSYAAVHITAYTVFKKQKLLETNVVGTARTYDAAQTKADYDALSVTAKADWDKRAVEARERVAHIGGEIKAASIKTNG